MPARPARAQFSEVLTVPMDDERNNDIPDEPMAQDAAEPVIGGPIVDADDQVEVMIEDADGPQTMAEPPADTAESGNDVPAGTKVCPNPGCQYDKHESGAHFCILCGTLLFTHCTDCLPNNPQYACFCRYCGADLAELRAERQSPEARSQ